MTAGVLAATATAQTPKVYSYEGGSVVPPWDEEFEAFPDRLRVVPSPTDPSHNVMRVEMRPGDLFQGRARAEAKDRMGTPAADYRTYPDPPGSERWYGWKTMLEAPFPSALTGTSWGTIISQWHSYFGSESPRIALIVDTGKFELHHLGTEIKNLDGTVWRGNAPTGVWHTFLLHVKWSPYGDGFVEFWHNGANVIPKRPLLTMGFDGRIPPGPNPIYLKHGIYRQADVTDTQVLFHDTFRIGTTRAQVEP